MPLNEISIKRYIPGDEPGVVELFGEVFGNRRTPEEWCWLYNDNVHGRGWAVVGKQGTEILGHYGVTRQDLCLRGRRIMAGQSGDAFVEPAMRRKGLFAELMDYCYGLAIADHMEATYGVPNRLSYPGLVQYSGWCKIMNLSYYYLRIGFAKAWGAIPDRIYKTVRGSKTTLIQNVRKLRYNRGFEVTVTSSIPGDLEDLLKHKRTYEALAIWKDAPYLKWRYQDHPQVKYLFHTARINNKPCALLVTRDLGHAIAICDLLHKDNDDISSIMLIDHLIHYYARSTAQKIEFYGHDAGFFHYVFRACGFKIVPFSPLVFGGRTYSNPDLEKVFLMPDHWTVAYGDTDII